MRPYGIGVKIKLDKWNKVDTADINPHIHGQLIFLKMQRQCGGKRIAFSKNGSGTIG